MELFDFLTNSEVQKFFEFIASKGFNLFTRNQEAKLIKLKLTENLIRKLQLNSNILSENFPSDKFKKPIILSDHPKVLSNLHYSAFDELINHRLPLSKIYQEKIDKKLYPKHNNLYLHRISNYSSLHELINRTIIKLQDAHSCNQLTNKKIDIGYLNFLHISCIKQLRSIK